MSNRPALAIQSILSRAGVSRSTLADAATTYRALATGELLRTTDRLESMAAEVDQAMSDLTADAAEVVTSNRWAGPITFEGEVTGDGRMLARDSLYWPEDMSEENPLPFRTVREDVGAHDNAVTSGHIFTIERLSVDDANARLEALGRPTISAPAGVRVIWGVGDFDFGSDEGVEGARLVRERLQTGVSVDLDDVAFEVRVAAELIAEDDEEPALIIAAAGDDPDENGREYEVVYEARPDDEIMVTTSARIRSATQVAIPAFAFALVGMLDEGQSGGGVTADEDDGESIVHGEDSLAAAADDNDDTEPPGEGEDEHDGDESLEAAAAPIAPPREWFADPQLSGPTPLRIDENGRIFGHLATWDTCHIASPAGEGVCVVAPHSALGYARFHNGTILTASGDVIDVGKITMGTGHAGARASAAAAAAHYDNTGAAVADVRAGEDSYGIWVAGALRPNVTPEQVRALRASPLSGDWRRDEVTRGLELRAALAVNVPGFPIPRPSGLVASGELTSLVASGVVVADETVDAITAPGTAALSASDAAYLSRLIEREKNAEARALAERVAASKLAINRRKVAAFAARR